MSVKEEILAELRKIKRQYKPSQGPSYLMAHGLCDELIEFIRNIPDEPEGVKKYAVYDNNDPISIFPLTATGKDFARITKCLLPPKHNPRVIEVVLREVKK